MQRALDDILDADGTARAYDMRHAMLYLAFPDRYGRIISTRDKEKIVEKFWDKKQGPVPPDVDEAIRRIRKALSLNSTNLIDLLISIRISKSNGSPEKDYQR